MIIFKNIKNKGVNRLLIVISFPFSLIFGIETALWFGHSYNERPFGYIFFPPLYFIGFWVFVRICLWIYDGFKEDK